MGERCGHEDAIVIRARDSNGEMRKGMSCGACGASWFVGMPPKIEGLPLRSAIAASIAEKVDAEKRAFIKDAAIRIYVADTDRQNRHARAIEAVESAGTLWRALESSFSGHETDAE